MKADTKFQEPNEYDDGMAWVSIRPTSWENPLPGFIHGFEQSLYLHGDNIKLWETEVHTPQREISLNLEGCELPSIYGPKVNLSNQEKHALQTLEDFADWDEFREVIAPQLPLAADHLLRYQKKDSGWGIGLGAFMFLGGLSLAVLQSTLGIEQEHGLWFDIYIAGAAAVNIVSGAAITYKSIKTLGSIEANEAKYQQFIPTQV